MGGVAILIRGDIRYRVVDNIYNCNNLLEVCAIEVFLADGLLIIVSCYRPPDDSTIDKGMWIQFLDQFTHRSLIYGDLNARHFAWGDTVCSAVGNRLMEALDEMDLHIVNDLNSTYLSNNPFNYSNSSIDLSLIHDSLAMKTTWEVDSDPWNNDHFPISITINARTQERITHRKEPKLYCGNIDWSVFSSALDVKIEKRKEFFFSGADMETKYTIFIFLICETLGAADADKSGRTSKKKFPPPAAPPCPWWNANCDKLLRLRKAALYKFQFNRSWNNFIEYKKKVAQARVGFKAARKESFEKFCEGLRKDSNPTYVWKKIKCFQNR